MPGAKKGKRIVMKKTVKKKVKKGKSAKKSKKTNYSVKY